MTDYVSTHTGSQIDEAVDIAHSLPAQITAIEAEIAEAKEEAKTFVITVTQPAVILDGDTSGITADKTFEEINAAINAGKMPVVKLVTQGKIEVDMLHLYKSASLSIVFRQQVKHTEDYNIVSALQCIFSYAGGISVDSVNFYSVPDDGTEGQVLVKTGDSTHGWRDSGELPAVTALTEDIDRNTAPPIIPTATGEIVTVSDSANRPLAGLRLYGKTTQDGTPTPSLPVEMVNVGADGKIGVYAFGKNLLPNKVETQEKNGLTFMRNADGSITITGTATANTTISIAGSSANYNYKLPAGEYILGGCKNGYHDQYFVKLRTPTVNTVAITTSGEDRFTHDGSDAWCYIYVFAGVTVNETIYPMIRPASVTDATYEPYKDGGSVTASTPNGLPGIPVTSGGNYIDSSGLQWLCDELDFGRGTYVQRVGMRTLNGTEEWSAGSSTGAWNMYIGDAAKISSGSNNAYCTHYKYHGASFANMDDLSFKLTITSDGLGEYMAVKDTRYDSLDDWKAALAANPITVAYILKTPVETTLPDDELAAYRTMTSQYPNTTVYNDAGAGMQVDYIADTKNYIDQKLAAIAAATI